jgi:hypothetical protein
VRSLLFSFRLLGLFGVRFSNSLSPRLSIRHLDSLEATLPKWMASQHLGLGVGRIPEGTILAELHSYAVDH